MTSWQGRFDGVTCRVRCVFAWVAQCKVLVHGKCPLLWIYIFILSRHGSLVAATLEVHSGGATGLDYACFAVAWYVVRC